MQSLNKLDFILTLPLILMITLLSSCATSPPTRKPMDKPATASPSFSTKEWADVDLASLVSELQKFSETPDKTMSVFWVPPEYWAVSFVQEPTIGEPIDSSFIQSFHDYILIVATVGKIDYSGSVSYFSESAVRSAIQLIDSDGTRYHPLNEIEIPSKFNALITLLKPILANSRGVAKEKLHFFYFPGKKNGQLIADPQSEGFFSIELGEEEFKWKLPLESLILPKICPQCGRKCSGIWNFCPWCGSPLPKR